MTPLKTFSLSRRGPSAALRHLARFAAAVAFVPAAALASACGPDSPAVAPTRPLAQPSEDADAATQDSGAPALPPGSNARESRMIADALAKVEQHRGLKATRKVPGHVLTRTAMLNKVKEHLAREVPDEVIVREGRLLQIFGLVPQDFDYKAAMFALLEDQLAGFYEPDDGTMYMAQDLEGDMADATLFHELVHALQDQTWDLKAQAKYRSGEGDKSFAKSALAEGDATSAMLDPLLAKSGVSALDIPDDKAEALILGAANTAGPKNTPAIMQASLISPYATGLRFVNALRRKGGWQAVNQAWATPPVSSEQILHLEKFMSHEPPIAVTPPTARALGPGFEMKDEDTNGELGFALMFDELLPKKSGRKGREVAREWGGDRMAFFQKGDEVAVAIRLEFDAAQGRNARRAFDIIARGLPETLGKPEVSESEGKPSQLVRLCFARKNLGPLSFAIKGERIVITSGPTKVGAPNWSSTSDCATATRWSKENAD
jgi:hypothetical protein